jgi:GR25 family glycosyltransferase involved in LPS biosynthesis
MTGQMPHHGSLDTVWNRIDRIYCISLEERRDRQASARHQFARAGLAGKVVFHIARRHPTDCEQGIFESHQAVLKMGLDAGARHILVFEDDIVFGRIQALRLAGGIDFFMNTEACRMLFLGCLARGSRATGTPGVRSIRYRCLTHAYLIRDSLAREIIDAPWQHMPYDIWLQNHIDHPFVLYPAIAFQSNSPSDNSRLRTLDTIRRLFGGLRFIQTVNERYHRFRYAVIAAHLLAVGGAILWMLS